MSKFYKISEEQLIDLLRDSMLLECLEKDGVDNWGYYGEGFETDKTIWAAKVGLPLFKINYKGVKDYYEYDYKDIAIARLKEFNLIL